MKKYCLLLFALCGLWQVAQAQPIDYYSSSGTYVTTIAMPPWYLNLQKYWYYRYRLVHDFTYIGPNPGESLIACQRNREMPVSNRQDYGTRVILGNTCARRVLSTKCGSKIAV